jgi:hypothetical protein
MAERTNEFKELAQRMMHERWDVKRKTMEYVKQVLHYYDQTELMAHLEELNYKELKMISGCGVPGHAWIYTVALLAKKKAEIELFISQGGQKATANVELETLEEES